MAPLLGKDDRKEIASLFSARMAGDVTVLLFTRRDCEYCPETRKLLEEIASLDARIKLEAVDIEVDRERAEKLGVEEAPTTVIVAANGALMHYVGMPGGRQLRPLVEDLLDASRGRAELDAATSRVVSAVKRPTVIKVFVTPACQFSPLVVRSAHKFALANRLVRAFMVETIEFPEVAKRYGVVGVPRTVINEAFAFDGAPGELAFAEKVLEASLRS